ncbi:helix-turn-helix domain-containing protein [Paenibacillus sinensis]|nr:helix-turn-helix domain-containing protein [Paenibacillus sinensis]
MSPLLPPDAGRWTLHLHSAELLRVKASTHMTQLMSFHLTLIVLLEGRCLLTRETKTTLMAEESVYVCSPGCTYELTAKGDSPLVAVIQLSLYAPNGDERGLTAADSTSLYQRLAETAVLPPGAASGRCRAICAHFRSPDLFLALRAQADALELLLEVAASPYKNGPDGLEQARRQLEEHPEEPLSTEKLAEAAGLSPRHFTELFKQSYGKSPLEYITRVRLEKAKKLMLSSGRRLKDIAHEVGYEDEFYFSRVFKKEYGFSPSHYISRRKRIIAAYGLADTLGYLLPLDLLPHTAPMHPKWTGYYLTRYGADIPYHQEYGLAEHNRELRLSQLAESKPELIVCPPGISREEFERMSAIASVFTLPSESPGSWRTGLHQLAMRMGMEKEAEAWMTRFDRETAIVRRKLTSSGKAPSILFVRMAGCGLYGLGTPGILDFVYRELGIARPESAPPDAHPDMPVNLQAFDAEDVDQICLLIRQDSITLEYWRKLTRSARWHSLSAVKEGRVHLLSSSPWREYSPIGLERIREQLEADFAENNPCRIRDLSMEKDRNQSYPIN